MKIFWSVNSYDFEGDISQVGIFLHFGDTTVKVSETVDEFERTINGLLESISEMKEQPSCPREQKS